jgi:hypothetical protein
MADIAIIDVIVPPPSLIEVITGTRGDPGPPGPPGPAGAAGPPGPQGAGADLPTAPIWQVLTAQGAGVAPVFRSSVILRNQAGDVQWELRADGPDFILDCQTAAGITVGNRRLSVSAFNGNLTLGASISNFEAGDGMHAWFLGLASAPLAQHNFHRQLGNLVTIDDSTTNTPGAVITGGGSLNVLARWNGTNWIVVSG